MSKLTWPESEATMFDALFDSLDWPGHLEATFDLMFHGPFGRCFFVSLDTGWTGDDIEALLAGRGIEIYARDVQQNHYLFWVANADVERAYGILAEAGCPVGIVEAEDDGA